MRRWWIAGIVAVVVALVAWWLPTKRAVDIITQPLREDAVARERQAELASDFAGEPFREAFAARALTDGQPFARLRIPSLDVDLYVAQGIGADPLRAGAGHYPDSAYPGRRGNVAISGHRSSYGEPFRAIDRLQARDAVLLVTPDKRYRYVVVAQVDGHPNPWVTSANDWTVIAPTEGPTLTLITSDPPGTDRNRLVVRLRLED